MRSDSRKQAFRDRVHEWADKLDVRIAGMSVRPMKHKWASCSTDGRLSFNTALLNSDPEVQDYVIVHELLHLSVPNHGKLWKSLMRAHLGDWEPIAERLNESTNVDRA